MTEVTGENVKPSETSSSFGLLNQADNKRTYVDVFLFFLLLAFGIYHAVIYWGHQVMPHLDFDGFAEQGRRILSFKLPADYKRLPLVGILQVLLGNITGGANPEFHGGWLLNSIVHPLTAVFLWLAGRKVIGRAAVWFAIIAIINPWGLQQLTESIAETTLLFFIWATFYLIFIRSKWAYLLASLATMVRYEGAALILCAFVMDMIDGKDKKQRLIALIFAALASAPLMLWMLGTVLNWQAAGSTHYFKTFLEEHSSLFAGGVEDRTGFANHATALWGVGFYPLFLPPPNTGNVLALVVLNTSKIIVFVSFLFGSLYGLYKRQWKILVLLLFFVPYLLIHVRYPYLVARYYATVFAIVMLICVYGLFSFWNLVKGKLSRHAIILAQVVVSGAAFIWALKIFLSLPEMALELESRASMSLPLVAVYVVFFAFIAECLVYKSTRLTDFVVLTLMILMIISNQCDVASVVGNGERDMEFKYLLEWYKNNAEKGEILVTTYPSVLQVAAPQYKDCFIRTSVFDANNPYDFANECYRKNITYVAWDSKIGLVPTDFCYKHWKVANIAPLAAGKDIGPYQFIAQLRVNQRQYINLYRLRKNQPDN